MAASVALGDVAQFIRGVTYKPTDLRENFSTGSVVCMRTANVQSELDQSDLKSIPATLVGSPEKMLRDGDLLVSTANSWNLVGKCCWVPPLPYEATAGGFIAILRANETKVDQRYLYHWFSSPNVRSDARNCGRQTTNISNMDVGRCLQLRMPLPALPEQRRIAALLDRADTLRAKRRQAIATLDQLLRSVFLDMFGDPVTNPKGWPKATMGDLFDIARGGSPRPIDAFLTDDPDGINWIMIGDTVEGSKYITNTRRRIKQEGAKRSRSVKPGDFLLTNSMSFGRPYILKTYGCIHDGWLVLSPKDSRTRPDFLFSVLASPSIYSEFAKRAPGVTVKNLNIDLVGGVEMPVPPEDLQGIYSRASSAIELEQERHRLALGASDELFSSLQSEAFSKSP